jgi:hypothetical protein
MRNFILKDGDPLGAPLQKGAVVRMSDGWRGKVETDDGVHVVMIRDGERVNELFRGYRGIRRCSAVVGGKIVKTRSVVVDLAARKQLRRGVVIIDRARLESEWEAADERLH